MNNKWVTLWGNTLSCDEFRPSGYAANITLRYEIPILIPTEKLRLGFSNTYGRDSVTLSAVTIGKYSGDGCVCDIQRLMFGGNTVAHIRKGESLQSDELCISLGAGDSIAVSIYLENFTDMHTAVGISGPLMNGMFAEGNFSEAGKLPPELSEKTNTVYFLETVDGYASESCGATVIFGDSISAQSWPEWLMLRITEEKRENRAVVRRAVSGSRVLREYSNLSLLKYGKTGVDRFEKDISGVSGADKVIVLHGVNDIIHPQEGVMFRPLEHLPTADELIDGYREYIRIAHKHGLKIYFATITPICGWRTYEPLRNFIREKVNSWIRSNTEADGFVDFAEAVCDRNDSASLALEFDSGDHLHPSLDGGKKLACCIPPELL